MSPDYTKHKAAMRAIGIPLLIIGIILLIYGFTSFGSGSFEESTGNMMMFAAGGFLTMIGFALVALTMIRPMTKYYATEMSPGINIASQSVGKGLKESGATGTSQKEIIKVKCPHCGYLESEDADFCSKCGKKI